MLLVPQPSDKIKLYNSMPPSSEIKTKKVTICYKSEPEVALTKDNVENNVYFAELPKNFIEGMSILLKEAYLPVLTNVANQTGWSDLISKDLMEKLNGFLAQMQVSIGLIKGRTVLPLPPESTTTNEKTNSKDKAHVLEGAIITWTKQIKNVLKQDPEAALKQGYDPDPLAEVDFWKSKAENLNSICDQLQTDSVKKVLKFLEQNKST